jgi:hypothetical protein
MCILEKIIGLADVYVNLFVCLGVGVAIISFYADHKRRKKQATFEFYHGIYKEFIGQLYTINEKFPGDSVINVDQAKECKAIFNAIEGYLSHMERFSVGINAKIYDIKVFERMVGAALTIKWFDRFQVIIDDFCKVNPIAYKDLNDLVSKLRKRLKKNPKQVSDPAKIEQDKLTQKGE